MNLRQWRSALAWALFAVIVVPPRALDAHAHLRRSAPTGGERLAHSPTELRLWFSEQPVLSFTRVQLLAADSTPVPLGLVTAGDEMSVKLAIARPLAAGTYTVVWRTAAADGHPSTGRYRFIVDGSVSSAARDSSVAGSSNRVSGEELSVQMASTRDSQLRDRGHVFLTTTPDSSATLSGRGYIAARWLELIALLAVIGAMVFRFGLASVVSATSVGGRSPDAMTTGVTDAVLRLLRPTLVLLFVAQLVRLGGELQAMQQGGAADVPLRTLLTTVWGYGWMLGVAGVVIAMIGAMAARRLVAGWMVAAAGTLVAALSPAVTGHAIASPDHPVLAVSADFFHVLGGGAWLGTLFVIVLVAIPAIRDPDGGVWASRTALLLTAFTPIALTGAGVILASGLVSAWLRLGSVRALWETPYGMVLMAKIALAGLIGAFGAWNWRSVQPSIAAGAPPARVRRSASMELAIGALLLVATAVLVALPTPS